jgi:hypothetical protein
VVKSLSNRLVPQDPPTVGDSQRKLIGAITTYKPPFGVDEEEAERRVAHHWAEFQKKRDLRAASQLLSAVVDLPARWIEDISGGRRRGW